MNGESPVVISTSLHLKRVTLLLKGAASLVERSRYRSLRTLLVSAVAGRSLISIVMFDSDSFQSKSADGERPSKIGLLD